MTQEQRKREATALESNLLLPEIFEEYERIIFENWRKEDDPSKRESLYSLSRATLALRKRINVRISRELGDKSQSNADE